MSRTAPVHEPEDLIDRSPSQERPFAQTRRRPRPRHARRPRRRSRRPRAAAPAGAKVVIIVGATHGATAGYRADADRAYAEAIKYTSNVIKVYSPNATWAKVKAAVAGASIVIYFGHGNGWPSPYTYDPQYTTKDGFGLNADGRRRRLQQQVLRRAVRSRPSTWRRTRSSSSTTSATPRATPSRATPSRPSPSPASGSTTTRAGFLKAGARAVIADGHGGPEPVRPDIRRSLRAWPRRRSRPWLRRERPRSRPGRTHPGRRAWRGRGRRRVCANGRSCDGDRSIRSSGSWTGAVRDIAGWSATS